jgi:D-beta-D-heptose 7-phosphate kinase/D-beta-D-heptose 1-phosphate adenosyltransferase
MSWITATEHHHFPAQVREVSDVTGAGDTVIATLAVMMGAGMRPDQASEVANVAAGIVVGKQGTATVQAEELRHALGEGEFCDTASWSLAQAQIERWRSQGLTVGFTNGCFDIIHRGHLSLLNEARSQCDRLVVGLNSDTSVKRLKGDQRPIHTQEDRAFVLQGLKAVDHVVTFDEDTPLELICALKPHVLVKGSDYTLDQVVGAKEVTSWGGRVHLADLIPGHSTTNILKRAL